AEDGIRDDLVTGVQTCALPISRKAVQLVIKKRDKNGAFQQIWSTLIDPASRFVNPSERKPAGRVWSVVENGAPSDKADILVIAEIGRASCRERGRIAVVTASRK